MIIQTRLFSDDLDALVAENKILIEDYEELEKVLVNDPEQGNQIQGTGGLRKIRLKSSTKGKRGGFRVCYFDSAKNEQLFFIVIYGKNEKENISNEDKAYFKKLLEKIKNA